MMARQESAGGVFKAVVHALFKSARQTLCMIGLGVCLLPGAYAQEADFGLNLDVQQKDGTFVTRASFTLPLKYCQAWQFLVDYDSARNIPGIVESKSQRLADNKVRVDRVLQDRILFVPIKMRSVIDFTELPNKGTDFVQIEGQAKSHRGSWRLKPDGENTVFLYDAVSEPDSALPMAVIRYFVSDRLRSSFVAMAQYGATRRAQACD